MGFQWDEAKRLANVAKHGIDFHKATEAFRDPDGFEYRSQGDHGEQRCVLIGSVDGRVLAVIFTVRDADIRIISARLARREERERWNANRS